MIYSKGNCTVTNPFLLRPGPSRHGLERLGAIPGRRAGGLLLGLALGAGPLFAGTIRYEPDANRICVSDFPEERPATLDDVLVADRAHGWKRIAYDAASDTYTLDTALWIGATNDWGTCFQIGRPDHPRETLVLRGDLVVTAPRPSPQRRDGRLEVSNRLMLGDPARPEIRPAVKMDCATKNQFSVRVLPGSEGWPGRLKPVMPLGELFMFHATLTAATPDATHAYATSIVLSHAGVNFQMADSTVSWWSGDLFRLFFEHYDLWAEPRVLRGMTFEHGDAVRWISFEDCRFRHLDTALTHGGAARCVFEENRRNIALHNNHVGALLLDCTIGPPARPPSLPRTRRGLDGLRTYSVTRHARDLNVVTNPGILECVSLPVRVSDAAGRPVPGAIVWLRCPAEPDGAAVPRDLAVTDRDGLTPGPGSDQALVIVTRERRPTDDPARPEERTYRYILRVEAPGHDPLDVELDGAADVPRPLPVVLTSPRGQPPRAGDRAR